eukprot:COSAG02_NODE_43_length_45989_cov_93.430181_45_plen_75_part_00
MDIPALGRDSVIFESLSFISLDSIMDSIDSSQIPVLIGRSQASRVLAIWPANPELNARPRDPQPGNSLTPCDHM